MCEGNRERIERDFCDDESGVKRGSCSGWVKGRDVRRVPAFLYRMERGFCEVKRECEVL